MVFLFVSLWWHDRKRVGPPYFYKWKEKEYSYSFSLNAVKENLFTGAVQVVWYFSWTQISTDKQASEIENLQFSISERELSESFAYNLLRSDIESLLTSSSSFH